MASNVFEQRGSAEVSLGIDCFFVSVPSSSYLSIASLIPGNEKIHTTLITSRDYWF